MPGVTAAAFDPKLADSPTALPNHLRDQFSFATITLFMLNSVRDVVKEAVVTTACGCYVELPARITCSPSVGWLRFGTRTLRLTDRTRSDR